MVDKMKERCIGLIAMELASYDLNRPKHRGNYTGYENGYMDGLKKAIKLLTSL